ncbi:MAG TPA: tetratricopeptide repeat protein [Ktedonobacteraceae bacterium]|nr:tetratricopeptide repeat protein [Ktedonobacteraceae bacterium]
MSADEPSFGALLKDYRQAVGLTQERLAERAGLSVRTISDLERGVNRFPRQETLDLLAQALRLSPRQHALLAASARLASGFTGNGELQMHPPHRIPASLTPLIGRETEVTRAITLLERKEVRLLTLLGPGGVGKTRLGLQIAEDVLDRFEDGVWFVALASLRDANQVAATIAQTLGLREAAGQAPEVLLKLSLREQHCLLLLDNFEQVTEASPLVAELLSACHHLKVLVTSRATLHLRGAYELPIEPLEQDTAVTLFLQRAQAVQPALDSRPETLQAIAAICQRLDRLPLALELAAVRVKVLPPQALLERLRSRLSLLTGGALDLPEHQRTMRDTLAWSYELLTPTEQRLFRELTIFAGGGTLEAAEAICGEAEESSNNALLEIVTALVDQSLVRLERATGQPRLTMLEVIREFALEQVQVQSEADTLHRRHAAYYLRLAEATGRIGPGQDRRDAQIIEELANIRSALEWAREHHESELGLRLATACGRTWYIYGMGSETLVWLETFLALDAQAGVRAAAPAIRIEALYGVGQMALERGDYQRAAVLAEEELALAERIGDESGMGNALVHLGVVAEIRSDLLSAARFLEQGREHCREAGDIGGTERALISLGHVFRALGDYVCATQIFEEALKVARSVNLTWAVANVLTSLGHLARSQGDYRRAIGWYRESLALHRAFGTRGYIAWSFEGMAMAIGALGQQVRAVQLCAAAEEIRKQAQTPRPPTEQKLYDQIIAAAQAALGSERFGEAWTAGRTLSLEDALAYAWAEPLEE